MKRLFCFVILMVLYCTAVYADEHWAASYINALSNMGVVENVNTYNPEENITRKEFVCMVMKAVSAKPEGIKFRFSDVNDNGIYAEYISLAAEYGIVTGYDDRTFRPDRELEREEATVILSRAFGFLTGFVMTGEYSDESEITPVAIGAFAYANRKGIVTGYPDNTVRPHSSIKKSEAAVMLCKTLETQKTQPRFNVGYPRIADSGIYGCIRLEVSTNLPCSVRYKIQEADNQMQPAVSAMEDLLVSVSSGNRQYTVDIVADVGKEYNVYLVAVTPDGRYSKITAVEKTVALPFTEGDGTEEKPYGLYNTEHLDAVRYFKESSYRLRCDIELSGKWEPIDDFYGTIDGAGFGISGLDVDTKLQYAGLFRRISKGKIKNLTVDGTVKARYNAGIFAGEMLDATITNCVASGYVSAKMNNAGGFFGESAGVIENCLSAVYLSEANAYAGGVVGQNYGIIKNTVSAAHTVVADMYAGGISAVNAGGKIEKSLAACINVYDVIINNCGRITSNKKDGITVGNYAYADMKTSSIGAVNDKDNNNGADISWEDMIDKNRASEIIGWDASNWSGGTKEQRYMIMNPKGSKAPVLMAGVCEYAPVRISQAAELLAMIDNINMHYLLTDDIRFNNNVKWTTVAANASEEMGFSGSLDGDGHTIYGLTDCEALIGTVSGGNIRNLRISGMKTAEGEMVAGIAKMNYGTVENCIVDDITIAGKADGVYAGGICAYNYGNIVGCEVSSANVRLGGKNCMTGGICAHNEGFIDDTAAKGGVTVSHDYEQSEAVTGGICGYNSGVIFNSFSDFIIRHKASVAYAGGICGIQMAGEIYKCSSSGNIISEKVPNISATAYVGGIVGLASSGSVMNIFSDADITVYASVGYVGGICGYNETALLQNSYAVNAIMDTDDGVLFNKKKSYTGGICGYNQEGTIGASVALNESILSYSDTGSICGGCANDEQIYSNFESSELKLNKIGETAISGKQIAPSKVDYSFFTKGIFEGGELGWSDSVWYCKNQHTYPLPVLRSVRYQDSFVK